MPLRDDVPVLRPLLPRAAALLPYLERIDATRWYSNQGPLAQELEVRLADHFQIDPARVATSANGTSAMAQVLQALEIEPGALCVMPSWTFVATAATAQMAGLQPFFVDVNPATWAIEPAAVHALLAEGYTVGAVIPVAPFGAPIDVGPWENFQDETGVPVLIDAAASFDSFGSVQTHLPYMVSLHATKTFGVGEGAVVVSGSEDFARAIRRVGNFGFSGSREAQVRGFNAKLSEYTAAVGLAGFDCWRETRAAWAEMTESFTARVSSVPGLRLAPGVGTGWVSSYGLVELETGADIGRLCEALAGQGIETRLWWGKGCHRQPAYRDCPRMALPHTEALAERVIGLPFWLGLDADRLDRVFTSLREILEAGR